MELYSFLGVLDDIKAKGRTLPITRQYKLLGSSEVAKEFLLVEDEEPTPGTPWVRVS